VDLGLVNVSKKDSAKHRNKSNEKKLLSFIAIRAQIKYFCRVQTQ